MSDSTRSGGRAPAQAVLACAAGTTFLAIAFAFVVLRPDGHALASSRGKVGYSGNPSQGGQTCARCHSGGEAPTVQLLGPSAVDAGTTHAYTLTIAGGQRAGGGLNVSATAGGFSLAMGTSGIQVLEGEVTHDGPATADENGDVVYSFLWQAPPEAGDVTLYAAGNSVDLNGNTGGDAAGLDDLTVNVMPGQGPTPSPTGEPSPTVEPPEYETVFADLNNPHGLHTAAMRTYLAAEGGTGDPVPGEFAPGNGDGRVQELGPMSEDRDVIVEGLTNAQDPGGGVVGANHAIPYALPGSGTDLNQVTLVAQAGGPGHLRPDEAAKVLSVSEDGTVTVLADTLAFEAENNPGGEEGPDGIDSNPWRLLPFDERVLITDAGANDVLSMDPETGALSLFAVFEPIGDSQAIPTGIARWQDAVYVSLLGPMFSEAPVAQVRRLEDLNDDGDALDAGENELLIAGLRTPTDLRVGPFGHIYVLEMLPAAMARIDPTCWAPGSPCDSDAREVVATGLTATTAMTWDDNFDALVTVGPLNQEGPSLRTDRIVRVPYAQIRPPESPTPTAGPGTDTPTPGTVTPTPTPATPAAPEHVIFLPWAADRGAG